MRNLRWLLCPQSNANTEHRVKIRQLLQFQVLSYFSFVKVAELFCGRSAVTRNVLRNKTKQSFLIKTNLVKPYQLINFSDMTFPQGTYRSLNYLGREKEKKRKTSVDRLLQKSLPNFCNVKTANSVDIHGLNHNLRLSFFVSGIGLTIF